MTRPILLVAFALACAGSKPKEAVPLAPAAGPSAAATAPAQPPPAPQQPPAAAPAPAPAAAPAPALATSQIGQQPQQPPPTGTAPAAQAQQPAPNAVPEPPLMPEEAFRDDQPAPLPAPPRFEAPVPFERKLRNGARVLIVENHQVPLVSVNVRFLHGVDADPADRPGLAGFMADTVDEGTKSRPAEKLAAEIEDLAAHLSSGAGLESATVHLNCLAETLPQALDLLADVVQNPAFRPADVERVRVLRLTGLEQKKASIGALAADEAARVLNGPDHPWGKPDGGTPESVAAITPEELAAFHDQWWVPNDAVISVSGDVKTSEIVRLLEKAFAGWKPHKLPKLRLPPFPRLVRRSIDGLDKPGATQSQVWVVGRLFRARDVKDAIPLRVANLTLGGLFTSRLNMNLREKHGYTYGARSGLSLMRDSGTFVASSGIIAKNTVPAVSEFESEMTKFSDGEVSDTELQAAKEALIRGIPSALETNDAVSASLSNLVSIGLPLDYYRTVAGRIAKVSKGDIRRVVRRWITPLAWPVIIVGPIAGSKDALQALNLGAVTVAPAPGAGGAPKTSASAR
ncbi:MAG TPA: pitrilysin family protein [Myxococcales bacterium]|nr:pitrilysin family protein [Myxococcales bacterium]